MFESEQYKTVVTARALIVCDEKLALVSHDGVFWYTPGGKLHRGETLHACVEREVQEEIGIKPPCGYLQYVHEFYSVQEKLHKVEHYFRMELDTLHVLPAGWSDKGGEVKYLKFVALEGFKSLQSFAPEFLSEGEWLKNLAEDRYKGVDVG